VAYVRFASVYRAFQDVGDFTAAVEGLTSGRAKGR
jgi:transcriptional regulator NrdR family protein